MSDPQISPESVRAALAELDATELKAAGGMVLVLMGEPEQARDREWVSEHFVQVASQALDLPVGELGEEQTEQLQAWVRGHIDSVLNVTYALFARVAQDLEAECGAGGFAFVDAARRAASYLVEVAPQGGDPPA